MVFTDGSVKAQLAAPGHARADRLCARLSRPARLRATLRRPSGAGRMTSVLAALGGPARRGRRCATISRPPDPERFPCVRLAYEALAAGGTAPAVLSAANEVAVKAFVEGKIAFGSDRRSSSKRRWPKRTAARTRRSRRCEPPTASARSAAERDRAYASKGSSCLLAVVTRSASRKSSRFWSCLSVLVVLHEFGHFIVARRNGVRVNEFAVGMGPSSSAGPARAAARCIRCARCRSAATARCKVRTARRPRPSSSASSATRPQPRKDDNFQAQIAWQRLAIVLAGPVANFVLCFADLAGRRAAFGVASDNGAAAGRRNLVAGSPAAARRPAARRSHRRTRRHGRDVTNGSALDRHDSCIARQEARPRCTSATASAPRSHVVPQPCPHDAAKKGCIGFRRCPCTSASVVQGDQHERRRSSATSPIKRSAASAARDAFTTVRAANSGADRHGPGRRDGPGLGLGTVLLAGRDDFVCARACSICCRFPALDGGRAAFIVAEMVRGKPVDPEKEAMVHIAGFAALMALMLFVAFHDIARIASGNGVM